MPRVKHESKQGINWWNHQFNSAAASDQRWHAADRYHCLATNTEVLCRRVMMWNKPVRYDWSRKAEGMEIVWKSLIRTWSGLISTKQGFYRLWSMPSSSKCTVAYLSFVCRVLCPVLHFTALYPFNEIQLLFWSFWPKTLASENCANTWYVLSVSSESTTMPVPLSCSSSKLWLLHIVAALRGDSSLAPLQCHPPAGLSLFTFALCLLCNLLYSLYTEANRKSPAINSTSRPHIRDEYVEQSKYSVMLCLYFTSLLLSHGYFTSHYPAHRLK